MLISLFFLVGDSRPAIDGFSFSERYIIWFAVLTVLISLKVSKIFHVELVIMKKFRAKVNILHVPGFINKKESTFWKHSLYNLLLICLCIFIYNIILYSIITERVLLTVLSTKSKFTSKLHSTKIHSWKYPKRNKRNSTYSSKMHSWMYSESNNKDYTKKWRTRVQEHTMCESCKVKLPWLGVNTSLWEKVCRLVFLFLDVRVRYVLKVDCQSPSMPHLLEKDRGGKNCGPWLSKWSFWHLHEWRFDHYYIKGCFKTTFETIFG